MSNIKNFDVLKFDKKNIKSSFHSINEMLTRIIPGLVLFSIILGFELSFSQEKIEPSSRPIETGIISRDSLPKINLPEFVITGKEKIELPIESKFEISGLRLYIPRPSDVVIPNLRDLNTLEMEPPKKETTVFSGERNFYSGYAKAGFGRFTTPFAEIGIKQKCNQYTAGIFADYISSKGHTTNSDYVRSNINGIFAYDLPEMENIFSNSKIDVNLGYQGNNYNFYGFPDNFSWHSSPDKRKINKFFINSSINSFAILPYNYKFAFNLSNYNSRTDIKEIDYNLFPQYIFLTRSENLQVNTLNTSLSIDSRIENINVYGNFLFHYNHIKAPSRDFLFQKYLNLNIGASTVFFGKLNFDLNLAYYLFRNPENYMDLNADLNKFFPSVQLRYFPNSDLNFTLKFTPNVQMSTNEKEISNFNYLQESVVYIKNQINLLDFTVACEYNPDKISKAELNINYFKQENTPIYYNRYSLFMDVEIDITPSFIILYSEKQSDNIYATVSYNRKFADSTIFDIDFRYIYSNLDSRRTPYVPYFVSRAALKHEFSFGLGIMPSFYFVGKRLISYSSDDSGEKLDAYFKFDFFAEQKIWNNFNIFLNMENIFNQKYYVYQYYTEPPFMIFAGLKFKL